MGVPSGAHFYRQLWSKFRAEGCRKRQRDTQLPFCRDLQRVARDAILFERSPGQKLKRSSRLRSRFAKTGMRCARTESLGNRQTLRGYVIKLSLIGMSGAGKSYWAQKLACAGFRVTSIDDRIEEKLAPELAAGDHRGIGGVAAWMGWPDDPAYRDRENKYLDCEIESMN